MKKYYTPGLILSVLLLSAGLVTILVASLSVTPSEDSAAVSPPPGPSPTPMPSPTPKPPRADLGIRNVTDAVQPNPLSSGVPMTYTFVIDNPRSSPLAARDVSLEVPLQGDQKFVSFSSTNPAWKLQEPVTSTVRVVIGPLGTGEGGTVTIKAIFPTNYEKSIFRQTVYLYWVDTSYDHRIGINLTVPVNLTAPGPGTPIPDPPRSPRPPSGQPTSGPFAPVPDPGVLNSDTQWYFPATHHILRGEFLNYWLGRRGGAISPPTGLMGLGYPVSEEFSDNGRVIQYFERVVMEFWPENPAAYKVLLRSLGREAGKAEDAIAPGTPSPDPGSVFYTETSHWLDGRFVQTWNELGGLSRFGFPIGEPVIENNKLIQWTERARFELDLSRPNQLVMLGLVGNEAAQAKGYL